MIRRIILQGMKDLEKDINMRGYYYYLMNWVMRRIGL